MVQLKWQATAGRETPISSFFSPLVIASIIDYTDNNYRYPHFGTAQAATSRSIFYKSISIFTLIEGVEIKVKTYGGYSFIPITG
jgi:hypothetical protein